MKIAHNESILSVQNFKVVAKAYAVSIPQKTQPYATETSGVARHPGKTGKICKKLQKIRKKSMTNFPQALAFPKVRDYNKRTVVNCGDL
ncbi:MAG: hypothetical protein IKW07_03675 [Clostridia bacterium]|nr:hypothetical protein [Clostridia bacterium]